MVFVALEEDGSRVYLTLPALLLRLSASPVSVERLFVTSEVLGRGFGRPCLRSPPICRGDRD
ncbi:MAG: hypothetical protein AVDCRST_MAG14-1328 [uncultured Rubrobacteraceae bacterium]|uniref:Uncharacterized protein n=1 Tax=uncultured Rubrobacteraceae bacterium TaxID=349277 RepID=A0A6J4QT25_9ACTN|nr:MAG: hypothetical protein AVDCRST_MAG14-1328 [uncultured Rubrobacteraceae bacterium]